jgi:hypothetical protein
MANSPAAARAAPPEFIARFELREEIERDSATLDVIGLLRVRVWADEEGELDLSSLPNPDSWLDTFDALPRDACRHWTIRERIAPCEPIAAARLTFHATLDDESARDLKLWRDVGRTLLLPCVDLGRLVVRKSHRRLGLAQVSCRAIAFAISHRRVACHLAIHVDHVVFRLPPTQQELNVVRIAAARAMGARTIVVTASQGNARLLARLGFESIGATVRFSDRPEVEFIAMELVL